MCAKTMDTHAEGSARRCNDAIIEKAIPGDIDTFRQAERGMTAEERLQPTELMPEMATLDCGTCNFWR